MKYTDETKNTVQVGNRSVPRGHRLWIEFEIDKAEEAGTIEPFQTEADLILKQIGEIESAGALQRTERLLRESRLGLDVTLQDGTTMPASERLDQIDQETEDKIKELREKLESL
jgi:hypothetical protein